MAYPKLPGVWLSPAGEVIVRTRFAEGGKKAGFCRYGVARDRCQDLSSESWLSELCPAETSSIIRSAVRLGSALPEDEGELRRQNRNGSTSWPNKAGDMGSSMPYLAGCLSLGR